HGNGRAEDDDRRGEAPSELGLTHERPERDLEDERREDAQEDDEEGVADRHDRREQGDHPGRRQQDPPRDGAGRTSRGGEGAHGTAHRRAGCGMRSRAGPGIRASIEQSPADRPRRETYDRRRCRRARTQLQRRAGRPAPASTDGRTSASCCSGRLSASRRRSSRRSSLPSSTTSSTGSGTTCRTRLGTRPFGAVLGPEAPVIALGSVVGVAAARFSPAGERETRVLASAGGFAAISALFGGPLVAGMLLVEGGIGMGAMLLPVLLPGLVAAGIGYLVFVGFGDWGGLEAPGLVVSDLPLYDGVHLLDLVVAVVIGVVGALIVLVARRAGERVHGLDGTLGLPALLLGGGLAVGLLAELGG